MRIDARILSLEKLDRARTVLVDSHSLQTLAEELTQDRAPVFDSSALTQHGGPTLANIIQNIVLHDTIVVDSLMFQVNTDVSAACELFPGIIRGVYLRPGIRMKIGNVIQHIAKLDFDPPPGMSRDEWNRWRRQESSEIPLMDRMAKVIPDLIPPEYGSDETLRMDLPADLPLCCTNSLMTLGRAHFYLELSRELGVPLSADPIRSRYFQILFSLIKEWPPRSVAEKAIWFFEDKVVKAAAEHFDDLISIDLSIPPVAELVVHYAKTRKYSLHRATIEIRESKNAIQFREWCARFA